MSIFNFQDKKKINCSVVIVAGGSSQRFGSDKLSAMLSGIPVLVYSLTTMEACKYVTEIIVVTESEKITAVAELCDKYNISKATKIVCGGETRLESALSGVSETDNKSKLIAIHDGARPLVTTEIIEKTIECAFDNKAAVPAIHVKDTVKIVSGTFVTETPARDCVYGIQTPQVFIPELIKGALTDALQKDITISDDASAVEALGFPVCITEGSEENIKITTPLDLYICETILESRKRRTQV